MVPNGKPHLVVSNGKGTTKGDEKIEIILISLGVVG
jgi:hypothetical protein